MKFVYKRVTRKLKRLKFTCKRCGCKFITNLHPDCTIEYSEFNRPGPNQQPVFVRGFVFIRTTCPDCGKIVEYDKSIDLFRNEKRIK